MDRHDTDLVDETYRDNDDTLVEEKDPTEEGHATTGGAMVAGALTGGAIGLAGGPVGAAVGAVGGAIVGAVTERVMHSEDGTHTDDDLYDDTEYDTADTSYDRPLGSTMSGSTMRDRSMGESGETVPLHDNPTERGGTMSDHEHSYVGERCTTCGQTRI